MADVPSPLTCGLDTSHPDNPEDLTDWPIDSETEGRIWVLESIDAHGAKGWDLRGDDD